MSEHAKHTGRVLIIVENLPLPFDRRVWQEATTLQQHGHQVTIICPTGKGYESHYDQIEGIHIYRHGMPVEGRNAWSYLLEYSWALTMQFYLALKVKIKHGFEVIHACNPPDNIFLVAIPFKLFGTKFIFDHHDINPELYEAKFNKRGFFYQVMLAWERWTFKCADVSIATNESYKRIAIKRGRMAPNDVFIVRSGPDLQRMRIVEAKPELRNGRDYLVGYVGVMGRQEGIDLLLQAVKYIVEDLGRTDVQFCLVGSGTEIEELKAMVSNLAIVDYVTFTGRVSDEVLLDYLNTADVCVNPDRANEMNDKSTMNKIMEYMALAKPIVQFDLLEGRFSAQESSLYAEHDNIQDFADKIVELLDDPQKRSSMGQIGLERVKSTLAWEYQVEPLLAAYDRALSKID